MTNRKSGFTVIELLVVIVIIGILATLVVVSYTSISSKAVAASLQSDLTNNSNKLRLYQAQYGTYPTALDANNCPSAPTVDNTYCLTKSGSNSISAYSGASSTFSLNMLNSSTMYKITDAIGPTQVTALPTFAKAYGTVNNETLRSLIQASDGNYIITGDYSSKMVIAKIDNSGVLTWAKTWGGASGDYGYDVINTSDGGYAVAGETASYGAGGSDAFIAKFDSSGNLSWSKTWGGTLTDRGYGIAQDSSGNYVLVGETASYGAGMRDSFVAKFDSTGSLLWSRIWGGTNDDQGMSVAIGTDGSYTITGNTWSFGTDAFIASYTSSGTLMWSKNWGGAGQENSNSILTTSDGGYIVAGETASYGGGGYDAMLTKFTNTGVLSWSRVWGGLDNDYQTVVSISSDGGYLLNGLTYSYAPSPTGGNGFFAKYDTAGNHLFSQVWGMSSTDQIKAIIQKSDGGYYAVGNTWSTGAGGQEWLVLSYNSSVIINGCNTSTMCVATTPGLASPSPTVSTTTPTTSSPAATVTSPAVTLTSITPTITTILTVQ